MNSISTICRYTREDKLKTNPFIIIAGTLILFYSNTILYDTFTAYSLKTSNAFKWRMLDLLHVINIISNLLYAFAILQISKRKSETESKQFDHLLPAHEF
jgi:hypothetical protein